MVQILKGDLDSALSALRLTDFTGGINTQEGSLSLSSNETPLCQNVIGFPGRLLYPGGTQLITSLPTKLNDGAIQFYDSNGAKHQIVWNFGNMYDTVNGIQVLIASSVYLPGQNIGHDVLNQVLYWTTATVTVQAYNGSTNVPVVTSGATGSVAVPSGTYICTYAGSLIVANPTIGGFPNPGSLIACNVNDPTTWLGSNLTALGSNNVIQALIPMSVEAGGVPPTSTVMCLGTVGLVAAQGPVNAFILNNINYPIGCKDGNSASYIPTGDILGNIVYLGTDNQFHQSNGITTQLISQKILNLMQTLVSNGVANNINQRFFASYNQYYHYYICDMGNDTQMVYKWTRMPDGSTRAGWFMFQGWPSGVYFNGTSGVGFPTNYVAVNGTDTAGTYEVGVDGANFNGVQPTIFYQTPYLHANDPSMMKEWQWVNLDYNNLLPVQYTVTAQGLVNAANVQPTANPILFTSPQSSSAGGAIWDISFWDESDWADVPALPLQQDTLSAQMLTVATTDQSGNAINMPLRSAAVSFTISWTPLNAQSIANFDVTNFSTRFKTMGHYMAGGLTGSAEA